MEKEDYDAKRVSTVSPGTAFTPENDEAIKLVRREKIQQLSAAIIELQQLEGRDAGPAETKNVVERIAQLTAQLTEFFEG